MRIPLILLSLLFFYASNAAYAQASLDARGGVTYPGGSIIPGYDSRVCGGSGAPGGAIRYNSSSSCVEYCDGTSWTCPDSSGGCTIGSAIGDGICAGNLVGFDLVVTQAGCSEYAASAADCSGNDADTQAHWAYNNVNLGVVGCTESPKACTDTMIAAAGGSHTVARYCRRHTIDDAEWQVPTIIELGIIDRNRGTGAWTNGGFVTGYYWSASQNDSANAHALDFYATPPMARPVMDNSSWVNHNIRCVRMVPQ